MCKLTKLVATAAMVLSIIAVAPGGAEARYYGGWHGGGWHGGWYGGWRGWGWGPGFGVGWGWGYPYAYYPGPYYYAAPAPYFPAPACGWANVRVWRYGHWALRRAWRCW